MMFFINYTDIKIKNGIIKYLVDEYSFNSFPIQKSLPALLIRDINLTFDYNTKTANDIWGYHPFNNWIVSRLILSKYCKGELNLLLSMDEKEIYRIPSTEKWQTYYDPNSGWVCIGNSNVIFEDNYDKYTGAIEFYPNVIAVLYNGELEAIWIKPQIVGNIKIVLKP